MSKIEIVSHPLCPHAQRLVLIALAAGWHRDAEFKVTYLPYATLRETAPQHSPTGELPVLKIDGVMRTANTKDAAEYMTGVTGLDLIPSDPELRLTVRQRESAVGALLDTMRTMFAASDRDVISTAIDKVFDHLDSIDADLAQDDTTEKTMRMDMAALEPAFSLLTFYPALRDHARWNRIPRLRDIARRSVENPWILASRCPDYGYEFDEFFKMTHSGFPALMLTQAAA